MHRRDVLLSLGATLTAGRLFGRPVEDLFRIGAEANDRLTRTSPRPAGPLGPFSARDNELVLTIAEHILPRSDTPGARDARVNEFIAMIVDEWYDDTERATFLTGLRDEDQRSRDRFGTGFLEATPAQQVDLLRALDAETTALRQARASTSGLLWPTIKGLTLYGYFTSQLVQTEVLKTVISPGRFHGCVPT